MSLGGLHSFFKRASAQLCVTTVCIIAKRDSVFLANEPFGQGDKSPEGDGYLSATRWSGVFEKVTPMTISQKRDTFNCPSFADGILKTCSTKNSKPLFALSRSLSHMHTH